MTETHLEDLTTSIKPRTASNLLLWFVVAFVVVFFIWAAVTELDRTVRGMGRVVPGKLPANVIVAPNSPRARAQASTAPAVMPGVMRGRVMRRNTVIGAAPKVEAASS